MNKIKDGSAKAIAHAFRTLFIAKIEEESSEIIFAVKKIHKLFHGKKFNLWTNYRPFLSIFGLKNGIPIQTAMGGDSSVELEF